MLFSPHTGIRSLYLLSAFYAILATSAIPGPSVLITFDCCTVEGTTNDVVTDTGEISNTSAAY